MQLQLVGMLLGPWKEGSSMPTISVAIHAILGIIAFGALQFPSLVFTRIAHSENVGAIRTAYSVAATRGKIFGPLAVVVALIGFWVASVNGIPLNSGWLIASYAVFVVLMLIGFGFHARKEVTIYNLAMASPLDAPSPELKAAIHDPLETPMGIASSLLWIALFYLMIAKPF